MEQILKSDCSDSCAAGGVNNDVAVPRAGVTSSSSHMSAVFRGNFHFFSSRHLASCFGFACPIPCKIHLFRTPGSLGAQRGLAQATRETSAGLLLTPLSRASLQIFTFMTLKTPRKFQTPPPPSRCKTFCSKLLLESLKSPARQAEQLLSLWIIPFLSTSAFISSPLLPGRNSCAFGASAALGAGLETAGNG